jgi:DUF1680 family protein
LDKRYNAGHLVEAAIVHKTLYDIGLLLDHIVKYVDLLCKTFRSGAEQKHGYPDHPEIELAYLSRFEKTGNPKGQDGRHYYDVESEARGDGDRAFRRKGVMG